MSALLGGKKSLGGKVFTVFAKLQNMDFLRGVPLGGKKTTRGETFNAWAKKNTVNGVRNIAFSLYFPKFQDSRKEYLEHV